MDPCACTSRKIVGSVWFPPDPGPHETAKRRFALWTADHGKSGSALSVLAPLSCDSCGRTLAKEFDPNFLAGASVLADLRQEDLTRWAAVHGHILLNSCSSFLRSLGCPQLGRFRPETVWGTPASILTFRFLIRLGDYRVWSWTPHLGSCYLSVMARMGFHVRGARAL